MAIPDLVLGSFDLTDWAGVAYQTSVIAEGTSRGAPVPLEVAVKTWLQDGSIVITQGYDNREVNLRVKFRGPNLTAVSQAEAAFFAELGKPNTLTWTPPSGPASVFNVITSSMQEAPSTDSDVAEGMAFPWRTYNVRLVCEAFVRSAALVTVPSLPTNGTTTTLVDAGSATTGWTGTINGGAATPAVVSGAVGITSSALSGQVLMSVTRAGSITTSATKYLVVDVKISPWQTLSPGSDIAIYGDGQKLPELSSTFVSAGLYRKTVYVAASSVSSLNVQHNSIVSNEYGAVVRTLHIDNINRTDIRPSFGTQKQQARGFDLVGSAPAPGSLAITSATNTLGDVLAYVWADKYGDAGLYVPAIRTWTVGGTVVADPLLCSGSRLTIPASGGVGNFSVPASAIPSGSYLVLARCAASVGSFSGSIAVGTKTIVGGLDLDTEVVTAPAAASFTSTAYTVYTVGKVQLPSVDVADRSTATLRINFYNYATAASIYLDELWLYNLDIGQLVWVQTGTSSPASGGPSRRVYIDAPTVQDPRPKVRRGFATDGSDAFVAGIKAWQQFKFTPPQVNLFLVTTSSDDTNSSFTYYPRWHTHAAA